MSDPNRWLKRSQYVSERIVVPTRKNNTPISFNPAPISKPKNNNNRKLFKPSPPRVIRTRKNRKASRKNRKTRVNRR
jgi:hypothetical protein